MRMTIAFVLFFLMSVQTLWSYPEFQRYSKSVSGRFVNCAMCHRHSDGPEGVKTGQIGSLSSDELNALGLARQALKPGNTAKSPILNEYGNAILNQLGRDKLQQLRQNPAYLPPALSNTSDLDGDGIPDVAEFLDGTDPLNSLDGHPWKLFKNNLIKNSFHLAMIILATGLGLYGLFNLLLWLGVKARKGR